MQLCVAHVNDTLPSTLLLELTRCGPEKDQPKRRGPGYSQPDISLVLIEREIAPNDIGGRLLYVPVVHRISAKNVPLAVT